MTTRRAAAHAPSREMPSALNDLPDGYSSAEAEAAVREFSELRERLSDTRLIAAQDVNRLIARVRVDSDALGYVPEDDRFEGRIIDFTAVDSPVGFDPDSSVTCWVSPDFGDLLTDAAVQLPPDTFPDNDVFPSLAGVVLFAAPIIADFPVPATDGLLYRMTQPLRGLIWGAAEGGEHLVGPLVHDREGVAMAANAYTPHSMTRPDLSDPNTRDRLTVMQLAAAFASLVTQPGVTATSTHRTPSAPGVKSKKGRTPKRVKQPDVRLIDLRPGTEHAAAYDRAAGRTREWRHRWMVRGHWRNQPYPSLGKGVTRRTWIAPYLKGPDGAPLLTTPKVHRAR